MKQWLKQWGGVGLFLVLFLIGLGGFIWFTSRPVELKAEDLTPAEERNTDPGLELSLALTGQQLRMTFVNNSGFTLDSEASVDGNRELIVHGSLDILLDGVWYTVPCEPFATAGVGLELAPGGTVQARMVLLQYGKLPDGQYRVSFGGKRLSTGVWYTAFARLDMEKGMYVLPETP